MPVVSFHLVEGQFSAAQHERLLVEGSRLFAEVLASPIERVRAFIHLHPPGLVAVGGVPVSREERRAPYFHFVVLEGRPLEARQRLLRGFTELLVEVLQVPRELVRGGVVPVSPDDWAIGGEPASARREGEIRARAEAAGASSSKGGAGDGPAHRARPG
jgi:phenylpyruvate tautomerase PptA (4-oxalocrotonate tautomerase family)